MRNSGIRAPKCTDWALGLSTEEYSENAEVLPNYVASFVDVCGRQQSKGEMKAQTCNGAVILRWELNEEKHPLCSPDLPKVKWKTTQGDRMAYFSLLKHEMLEAFA